VKITRQQLKACVLGFVILGFSFLFWSFRFDFMVFAVAIATALSLPAICLRLPSVFKSKHLAGLVFVPVALVILSFCYLYSRHGSYDGDYFHLKVVYSVMETGSFNPIYEEVKPYAVEFVLGSAGRILGGSVINLAFGTAAVLSLVLCYQLYRLLQLSERKSLFLISCLVASPIFIGLSLLEFKTDIFLFIFILLTYIIFYKLVVSKKPSLYLIVSILLGVCILIKLSIAPFSLILFFCSGLVFFSEFKRKYLYLHAIALLLVVGPYFLWAFYNGSTIPMYQKAIGDKTITLLEVNKDITRQCQEKVTQYDYDSYIYGRKFPLVLAQPFFYLSGYKMHPNGSQYMATLGPTLYLFVLLSTLWPLFRRVKKTDPEKYLYTAMLFQIVIYYIMVRNIFWYLFPILPLCMYFSYKILEDIFNTKLSMYVYSFILANSLFLLAVFFPSNIEAVLSVDRYMEKANRSLSHFLETQTGEGLILDTSFQQWGVTYPYFVESSKRVVKADFLFSDPEYSNERGGYEKIRRAGIQYLVVRKYVSDWPSLYTTQCAEDYVKSLNDFIVVHTEEVYSDERGLAVYKII